MMPWRDWIDPAWWRTMPMWWRVLLLSAWFAIIICVLIMVIVALYALVNDAGRHVHHATTVPLLRVCHGWTTGAVEPRAHCPISGLWSCGVPPASSNHACRRRQPDLLPARSAAAAGASGTRMVMPAVEEIILKIVPDEASPSTGMSPGSCWQPKRAECGQLASRYRFAGQSTRQRHGEAQARGCGRGCIGSVVRERRSTARSASLSYSAAIRSIFSFTVRSSMSDASLRIPAARSRQWSGSLM